MSGPAESKLFLDAVWATFTGRGVPEGSPQELHVSWRCPSIAAAEALEEALRAAGTVVGVAQPNAEAGGRGFGVAATVPVLATRPQLEEALVRVIALGAEHGAVVAGVGTTFQL
jgi:hypothetical protein